LGFVGIIRIVVNRVTLPLGS